MSEPPVDQGENGKVEEKQGNIEPVNTAKDKAQSEDGFDCGEDEGVIDWFYISLFIIGSLSLSRYETQVNPRRAQINWYDSQSR